MPDEGAPSDADSSSRNSSSSHGEQEEAPRTADQIMLDQDRAMDDFMVAWFGADNEDDVPGDNGEPQDIPNDPRPRHTPQGQQQWEEAKQQACTPIFEGARLSRLSAILGLLNIQAKHKGSNSMLSDIFQFYHDLMLPEENVLPGSWSEAKKVLSSMSMEYHIIHACVNDCMLFHGDTAHVTQCTVCGEQRYESNMLTSKVSRKAV
ncbi:unnamed protein product [Calypogeia fissa]